MIVTLTANPSLDRTVTLAGPLERGAVIRTESMTSQAGGKGVNISRAAVSAGLPSIAVLPAPKDDPFVIELLAAGIDCRPVTTTGDLRVNITITEPDGTTTKLNSPGAEVTPDVLTDLEDSLRRRAGAADWIVLAGSLAARGAGRVVRRPRRRPPQDLRAGCRRHQRGSPEGPRVPARRRRHRT